MRTPLAVAALISAGLLAICLTANETSADPKVVAPLAVLVLISDLVALPVPRRGYLSNSFIWIYLMAQVSSITAASSVLIASLALRFAFVAKGNLLDRVRHLLSESLPALAGLVVIEALPAPPSHGFPRGLAAAGLAILVYYLVGRLSLAQLYTVRAGPDRDMLRQATSSESFR